MYQTFFAHAIARQCRRRQAPLSFNPARSPLIVPPSGGESARFKWRVPLTLALALAVSLTGVLTPSAGEAGNRLAAWNGEDASHGAPRMAAARGASPEASGAPDASPAESRSSARSRSPQPPSGGSESLASRQVGGLPGSDNFDANSINFGFWRAEVFGSGPSIAETNQQLEISLPATTTAPIRGLMRGSLVTRPSIQGDFDLQVDYRLLTWPVIPGGGNGVRVGLQLVGEKADVERTSWAAGDSPNLPGDHYATHFSDDNFFVGNTPVTSDLTGTLRLTRVLTSTYPTRLYTYTGYYKSGSSWVPIYSYTQPGSDLPVALSVWSHDGAFAHQSVKVAFDNFVVNVGTFTPPLTGFGSHICDANTPTLDSGVPVLDVISAPGQYNCYRIAIKPSMRVTATLSPPVFFGDFSPLGPLDEIGAAPVDRPSEDADAETGEASGDRLALQAKVFDEPPRAAPRAADGTSHQLPLDLAIVALADPSRRPPPANLVAAAGTASSLPGGDIGFAPGGDIGFAPGGDIGFAPGGDIGFAPGGDIGFAPGGDIGFAPGESPGFQNAVVAWNTLPGFGPTKQIVVDTLLNDGYFYFKVAARNGTFDPYDGFVFTVQTSGGIDCAAPPPATTSPVSLPSGYETLILYNAARFATLYGAGAEAAFQPKLAAYARQVNGLVVDVSATTGPYADAAVRDALDFLYTGSTRGVPNTESPCAIREAVSRIRSRHVLPFWTANSPPNALTAKYVVVVGGTGVFPKYLTSDLTFIANERIYDGGNAQPDSISRTGPLHALISTDDFYGCLQHAWIGNYEECLPDLAVGRLVETPAEIAANLDVFASLVSSTGALQPVPVSSAAAFGYDFVADTAGVAGDLMQRAGIANTHVVTSNTWTTGELIAQGLNTRRDILFSAGHCAHATCWGPEYESYWTGQDVANSRSLASALVYILGCHGGQDAPDEEWLTNPDLRLDLAQAFSRAHATYVGSTGFAYGESFTTAWSEDLASLFFQTLMRGQLPVGLALQSAKVELRLSASFGSWDPYYDKALKETSLYGFPQLLYSVPTPIAAPGVPASPAATTAVPTTPAPGMAPFDPGVTVQTVGETFNVSPVQVFSGTQLIGQYPAGPSREVQVAAGRMVLARERRAVDVPGALTTPVFLEGVYREEPHEPFFVCAVTELRRSCPPFFTEQWYRTRIAAINQRQGRDGPQKRAVYNPNRFRSTTPLTGRLQTITSGTFLQVHNPNASVSGLVRPTILAVDAVTYTSTIQPTGMPTTSVQVTVAYSGAVSLAYATFNGVSTGPPLYNRFATIALTPGGAAGQLVGRLPTELPDGVEFTISLIGPNGSLAFGDNAGYLYRPSGAAFVVPPPTTLTVGVAGQPATAAVTVLNGSPLTLTASLTVNGQGVPGKAVNLGLGSLVGVGVTDAAGQARVTLRETERLLPGAYTPTAAFRGDRQYLGSSAEGSPITVRAAPTAIDAPSGTLTLTAPLSTVMRATLRSLPGAPAAGLPLADRPVVVTFSAAGVDTIRSIERTTPRGEIRLSVPQTLFSPIGYKSKSYTTRFEYAGAPGELPSAQTGPTLAFQDSYYYELMRQQIVAEQALLRIAPAISGTGAISSSLATAEAERGRAASAAAGGNPSETRQRLLAEASALRDAAGAAQVIVAAAGLWAADAKLLVQEIALTLQAIDSLLGNPAPTATVPEAGSGQLVAYGLAPDGTIPSYAWDLDNNGSYETPGQVVSFSAAGIDGLATRTVGLQTCSSAAPAQCTATTGAVTIVNVPPTVTIGGPPAGAGFAVTAPVTFTGRFTDPMRAVDAPYTANWTFGGISLAATPSLLPDGSGTVGATRAFTAPGIYTVTLQVTDKDGGVGTAMALGDAEAYVAIYDTNGPFLTGGGWINSPAGAYPANPSLAGKANFSANAKYNKKGATPTGNTEFQLEGSDLHFKSTSYDWLAIAGAKAQLSGSGTINGAGSYGFLLTAVDGKQPGGGGQDKLRIRIWNKSTGRVVYDSQLGASVAADPATALGGGNVTIHKP